MKRSWKLVAAILALLASAPFFLSSIPVVLLPHWGYQLVHGWRYPKSWNCEDGRVLDQGPGAASDRYQVQLGQVDLANSISKEFGLCKLPDDVPLLVGVAVTLSAKAPSPQGAREVVDPDAMMVIELKNSDGQLLLSHRGRFRSWIWSGPHGNEVFVYQRGTFFADSRERYSLHVQATGCKCALLGRLVIQGGGWKT